MKFSCDSSALQRGVSVVQNVSQSKIANPIVENILIIAEGNQVLFIGTNLTQTLRCCIEAQVDREGQIAVPGKYLGNLVREIGAGTVQVDLKKNRLNLQCGKNSYRLGGIPAEEFPPFLPLSSGETVMFTSAELKDVIRKTVFCTSTEKARFELDGVKIFGAEQEIMFFATDGRRLSRTLLNRETPLGEEISALIPTRTWQELGRALPEGQAVQVTFEPGKVMFEAGDVTLLSSLLGDNFPPFDQIVPKSFSRRVTVDKAAFESALRRACVLASESTHQVILEIAPGEMIVRGESQELGDARDVVEVQYDGDPIKVSYKGDYILDFLRSASTEKVTIELNEPVSPAGYREAEHTAYLHIIMPMKIQEEEILPEDEENS